VFVSSPEKFADWFNSKILNACRKVTADDVRIMTECNLIGRYRFYGRQDLETIRGILQYEQLRENRPVQQDKEKKPRPANAAGKYYFQSQKVGPGDPGNTAPRANLIEIETGNRS